MSDFDLLIRGGGSFPEIGIVDGKFAAFERGSAREEIDARGLQILPGVIDAHVHFNEPGRADWEGIETGSRAAAAGGTTTYFDMPLNAHPPTIDGPSFDAKRAAAEANSLVDFALWGGLVPNNLDQIEVLRDRGVIGLKAFMTNSGIEDFPSVDLGVLRQGMKRAAESGLIVAVHAESDELTRELAAECIANNKTGVRDYLDSRPVRAELDAIHAAIELAGETGCALHVVHVSSGRGVALVTEARSHGVDVTCETCPHYLALTEDDVEKLGAVAKCAPPLRSEADRRELLARVRAGEVATIGSDHSPSPWSMKENANFFKVWGGISGCQHLLRLLIDAELDVDLIARVTAENVARRFRIGPRKGGIEIGADADCVLIDLVAEETVNADALLYRHKHSPYVGRKLRGAVTRTLVRGQTVYQNGEVCAPSRGQLIKPNS